MGSNLIENLKTAGWVCFALTFSALVVAMVFCSANQMLG